MRTTSQDKNEPSPVLTITSLRQLKSSPERIRRKKEEYVQAPIWSEVNKDLFTIVRRAQDVLEPGLYLPVYGDGTWFVSRLDFSTQEELIDFEPVSKEVIEQIKKFWDSEQKFREFKFPYRRGILLHGPAGSGKSSIIKLIIRKVISMNGIALKFASPEGFNAGMGMIRKVQPDMPVVCLMEDIDATVKEYNESDVLNILDGVSGYENIVYIATTNYPEALDYRIKNRPSRFDKRYRIPYPKEDARRKYISHLASRIKVPIELDLEQWVKDSERFTVAHMKELFISVILFGNEYEDALETLRAMQKGISSKDDEEGMKGRMGFGG